MKRSGPLKRTAGLKRGSWPRGIPRVAIAPVSEKRKALNRERAKVIAQLRPRVRHCQANPMLRAALERMTTDAGRRPYLEGLQGCHLHGPLVGHEPQKRSRRGSIVDPANILLVCEPCNAWCERHVEAATEAGLLVPSTFERDRS